MDRFDHVILFSVHVCPCAWVRQRCYIRSCCGGGGSGIALVAGGGAGAITWSPGGGAGGGAVGGAGAGRCRGGSVVALMRLSYLSSQ